MRARPSWWILAFLVACGRDEPRPTPVTRPTPAEAQAPADAPRPQPERGPISVGTPRPDAAAPARAAPAPDASALDLDALSLAVQARGNEARQQNGAPLLAWSDSLATLARRHSEDMAARGFFEHTNPDGRDVNARGRGLRMACALTSGETTWRGYSENLLYTSPYAASQTTTYSDGRTVTVHQWKDAERIAREALVSWLDSPGHRANLLQPRSRSAGVGAAISADRRVYLTHVFC